MAISPILTRLEPAEQRLRVLTHNIFGRQAGWEDRRRVLQEGIRRLQPDVATLQETTLVEGYDQIRDLFGDDVHIVHSDERGPDGVGISIVSRWPITDVQELDLKVTPRTADFACTALLAAIAAPPPFGPLLLINHFPDYQLNHEYERELQTVLTARSIEKIIGQRDLHVVLAGDLDAEPDAASIRFLAGKQSLASMSVCYRDTWERVHPEAPGHTFTAKNPLVTAANWDWPFQQIDHIFVRCGEHGGPTLDITACELAFNEPIDGVWASDHFALVADLAVPNARRPL